MRHELVIRDCCLCGVLVLALAFGCNRSVEPEPEVPQAPPHPLATSGQIAIQASATSNDRVELLVANGTKAPVEVRRALQVEQLRDEEWFALEGVGPLWVRDECEATDGVLYPEGLEEQCLTLPAETVVEVSPWFGTIGDAQCGCEECAPVPAGRYRVVLSDCHGGRFESEPFGLRLRDEDH